jgi:hypothetical protein
MLAAHSASATSALSVAAGEATMQIRAAAPPKPHSKAKTSIEDYSLQPNVREIKRHSLYELRQVPRKLFVLGSMKHS